MRRQKHTDPESPWVSGTDAEATDQPPANTNTLGEQARGAGARGAGRHRGPGISPAREQCGSCHGLQGPVRKKATRAPVARAAELAAVCSARC